MKTKKIIITLTLLILLLSIVSVVSAIGKTTDLRSASGLEIKEDGTIIDNYDSNKAIGTITPMESLDQAEEIVYGYDSELIKDTLSNDPLILEYIVEDTNDESHSGIYFVFGHDGNTYLGFVKTENMGNGMLKRITEFGELNSLIK